MPRSWLRRPAAGYHVLVQWLTLYIQILVYGQDKRFEVHPRIIILAEHHSASANDLCLDACGCRLEIDEIHKISRTRQAGRPHRTLPGAPEI